MNEALCSIISGEKKWIHYDEFLGTSIKFNADGTGELRCGHEHWHYIFAEIEWKSIGTKPLDGIEPASQITNVSNATPTRSPLLLGVLNIEITLINRVPRNLKQDNPQFNEWALKKDAFRTRAYTVRIEKGNFIEPAYSINHWVHASRYAIRLVFDKSPYPPQSEWNQLDPLGITVGSHYWDIVEFAAGESRDLKKEGRAMNDLSPRSWNSCTVS